MAGRVLHLEQRLVEQPGYSAELLLHRHPHPALIMATRPTDLLLTDIRGTHRPATDTQAIRDTPPIPGLRATDTKPTRHSLLSQVPRPMDRQATLDIPLTRNPRLMDTRADRHTLPIPVPAMDIRWQAIPAIAPRSTGRLEGSTLWNRQAEFLCKPHPRFSTPLIRGRERRSASRGHGAWALTISGRRVFMAQYPNCKEPKACQRAAIFLRSTWSRAFAYCSSAA